MLILLLIVALFPDGDVRVHHSTYYSIEACESNKIIAEAQAVEAEALIIQSQCLPIGIKVES